MSVLRQTSSRLFGADSLFVRKTKGGIRPRKYKQHSLRSRIMAAPIPPLLTIPLGSADSRAISLHVEVGQHVCKYQPLASVLLEDDLHAELPVHASTSGTVTHIELAPVADHRKPEQFCIRIEADGADKALSLQPEVDYSRLSSDELVARLHAAGLVGMGGAGFPTSTKLNAAEDSVIDLLIINAAECEPYITADEALIREYAERVLLGADILRRAASARRCVIAIEDSKKDAIAAMQKALSLSNLDAHSCSVLSIPSKYPAGSERQLIQCVSGIEVPRNTIPAQRGILVLNAGTAGAAFEAIAEGRPCIHRIVTLCGEALKTPKNLQVLVGTAVDFLFRLCGIDEKSHTQSVVGGSLMGRDIDFRNSVVAKTTNCLIAAGKQEFPSRHAERACIRCGVCADVCPAGLLPQQLLVFGKTGDSQALIEHGLFDCIECGACDYVCPSHIPLVSGYKSSKQEIESRHQDIRRSEYWQQRFQFHQYRLKRDKDEAENRKAALKIRREQTSGQVDEQQSFSKEKASMEIAAAVARVKARREQQATGGDRKDAPSKDDST